MNFQKWTKIWWKKIIFPTIFNFFKRFFGHAMQPSNSYIWPFHNFFVTWTICWKWLIFWIGLFLWHKFLKNHNFHNFQPILKIFSDIERTWSGVENIQSSSGFPILVEDKFYAFLTELVLIISTVLKDHC